MSDMNFLESLLGGVAVEWKTLGAVTKIKTGQSVNKQIISANPGDYPVINSGREPLGFINEWNTDYDPIGITTRGAGVGSITWQEGKYFRGNLNYSVTINSPNEISTRYLYHLLLEMQPEIQALCTFDGIPALNAGNLKELMIPIPCPDNPDRSLAIQAEIVRILDTFTALTAELTAELSDRKKQYNYYRDRLLTFEKGEVEWKTLGEIVTFRRGSFPQPYGNSSWYDGEGSMPFVQVADVSDFGFILNKQTKQRISKLAQPKSVFVKAGTVIVTLQGTIGRVAITQYDCYVDRR
jgi:type I restriction enzyme S subunit